MGLSVTYKATCDFCDTVLQDISYSYLPGKECPKPIQQPSIGHAVTCRTCLIRAESAMEAHSRTLYEARMKGQG